MTNQHETVPIVPIVRHWWRLSAWKTSWKLLGQEAKLTKDGLLLLPRDATGLDSKAIFKINNSLTDPNIYGKIMKVKIYI